MTKKIDLTKNETVEYYINGKLFKTCPYAQINKVSEYIRDMIHKKGYVGVWTDSFLDEIPFGAKVYVNIKTGMCIVVAEKINTSITDKCGQPLYHDDWIVDAAGHRSMLNMHCNNETYYVRYPHEKREPELQNWSWNHGEYEFNLTDFSDWTKVEDVLKIPKKHWKKPLTISAKDF